MFAYPPDPFHKHTPYSSNYVPIPHPLGLTCSASQDSVHSTAIWGTLAEWTNSLIFKKWSLLPLNGKVAEPDTHISERGTKSTKKVMSRDCGLTRIIWTRRALVSCLIQNTNYANVPGVLAEYSPLEEVYIFFDTVTYDEIERDVKVKFAPNWSFPIHIRKCFRKLFVDICSGDNWSGPRPYWRHHGPSYWFLDTQRDWDHLLHYQVRFLKQMWL